jgi:hypothetical protein
MRIQTVGGFVLGGVRSPVGRYAGSLSHIGMTTTASVLANPPAS